MSADREQAGVLAWVGAGAVLAVALARMATIASGELPYWFTDPWAGLTPEATITPMVSLMLDAMVWLASAAMIVQERKRGRRIPVRTLGAILAGALVVGLQGFVLRSPEAMGGADGVRGHFGSFLLGSVWVSAMLGAWTLTIAARDRALRNTLLSIILGSVVLFAIKAIMNVTVEHGALVERFRENPRAFLAQNGIEPGTPAASVYERRLLEPQATGWIALSNAFGTIAAALTLGLGATALCAWRVRKPTGMRSARIAGLAVLVALAGLMLFLSRSKGAAASMVLAAVLLVIVGFMRTRVPRKWLMLAVVMATLAPLGAVAARGVMGDQLGERSLLFRWQYLVGATRIIGEHPLFGVGADGFKSAYHQVRLPDAVEEVSSPHSVMFDWVACLGIAGIAWCAVWFVWLARGVRNAIETTGEIAEPTPPDGFRADALTLGVIGFAGFASLWSEWAALTQVTAGLHLIGFLVWIAAARAVRMVIVKLPDRAVVIAASGAALVVAVHSQMEVTPVIVGSAGLALAMLGLAAAYSYEPPARAGGNKASLSLGMAGLLIAGALVTGGYSLVRVRGWETMLKQSALWIAPGGDPQRVVPLLDRARDMLPSEAAGIAGVRTAMAAAVRSDRYGLGEPVHQTPTAAVERASQLTGRWPGSPEAWSLLAWTQTRMASDDADGAKWLEDARSSWQRVAELDPQGVRPVFEMWRLKAERGVGEQTHPSPETVDLARRVLEMDERVRRMDPLRGLSRAEREMVARWLAAGRAGEE